MYDIIFQLSTKIHSCKPAQIKLIVEKKKEKVNGFEVVLEDTILFPEGGGQV